MLGFAMAKIDQPHLATMPTALTVASQRDGTTGGQKQTGGPFTVASDTADAARAPGSRQADLGLHLGIHT